MYTHIYTYGPDVLTVSFHREITRGNLIHYHGSLHVVEMLYTILTIISTSFSGADLRRIRSSLVLLGIIVKEFLKRLNPTILMQPLALLPLSILNHEIQ